ncbi:MAG: YaiI/YqxD family protein [bacterium]|nr:YaiI/YqxD family protein [bacterium]
MQIWVDADACPRAIKEILYRAAERAQVSVTFVANQPLRVPRSEFLRSVRVPKGFDVADHRIVELMETGDLVITADIPLAGEVVESGGCALDPRGTLYTEENVAEVLATRNLLDQLRSEGQDLGGPPPLGKPERQAFANALDRVLQRRDQAF